MHTLRCCFPAAFTIFCTSSTFVGVAKITSASCVPPQFLNLYSVKAGFTSPMLFCSCFSVFSITLQLGS